MYLVTGNLKGVSVQLVKLEQMEAEELGYQVGVSGKFPAPGAVVSQRHEVSHYYNSLVMEQHKIIKVH